MHENSTRKTARKPLAVGVAAALALGGAFALGATSPAAAAPLSINHTALQQAVPDNVIDVRRRHRQYSGHAIAGLALGIIGTVIAERHYRKRYRHQHHYYHSPHYYYGPPSCIRRHGAVYCR